MPPPARGDAGGVRAGCEVVWGASGAPKSSTVPAKRRAREDAAGELAAEAAAGVAASGGSAPPVRRMSSMRSFNLDIVIPVGFALRLKRKSRLARRAGLGR